jgi:hydrogenase maturation protein HypF
MLPYTPLHYLLFANPDRQPVEFYLPPLIMTSGNLSDEPIATDNETARQELAALADAFLMDNRDIYIRCDDSVVRVADLPSEPIARPGRVYPLRRSRGYSPFPVRLPWQALPVLGVGAELKNTFCLTQKDYAFLSHHIGDLENYETLQSFLQGVEHFERLFRARPVALACDLHPNYLATRYALERAEREGLPVFSIQHHHAHSAACMAENGLAGDRPVIGLAFDGTGYGEDGAIWGGEVLLADYQGFQRAAHLAYFPLPGGDAAIRKPARTALALLWSLGLEWDDRLAAVTEFCAQDRSVLRMQLEKQINTPFTSSLGRLFDAAAALAGVRQKVNYEAQAAIEFEALADAAETGAYLVSPVHDPARQALEIDLGEGIEALLSDVLAGVPVPVIAARFHNGIAEMSAVVCRMVRESSGINEVALSGGVWQNMTLLRRVCTLLEKDQFIVYVHQHAPANDGGLALGQAVIAVNRLRH